MAIDPAIQALIDQINANAGNINGSVPKKPGLGPNFNPHGADAILKNGISGGGGGLGLSTIVSPFQHLLDYIQRPLQGVEVGTLHAQQNHGSQLSKIESLIHGFGAGFTGHERTTGQQLVENRIGKGGGRGTLGFLADVGLDPLNLVGGKAIEAAGAGIKALKGGSKVAEAAADVAPAIEHNPLATIPGRVGNKSATVASNLPEKLGTEQEIAQDLARVKGKVTAPVAGAKDFGKALPRDLGPATAGELAQNADRAKLQDLIANKAKTAAIPKAPKPITEADLTDNTINQIRQAVQARIQNGEFDRSPLAARMGKGTGPMTWEKIAADPAKLAAVTKMPEFRQLYNGIKADETNKALTQINAARVTNFAKTVQALNKAAPVPAAAASEVAPAAVQAVEKPLSEASQSLVDSVVKNHIASNGAQSLSPLGQGKLRQSISNAFFKANPGTIGYKNAPRIQGGINKLYSAAHNAIHEIHPSTLDTNLTDIAHTLKPAQLRDPREIEAALRGGNVIQDATNAAATAVPKNVQKPFVKGLLDAMQHSGSYTEVQQAKYLGQPVLKYHSVDAAAEDLGLGKPPPSIDLSPSAWANEQQYKNHLAFLGKSGEMLNHAFSTAARMNASPVEHSVITGTKEAVNTQKQHAIDRLRTMFKGADVQGIKDMVRGAQEGSTQEGASAVANHFNDLKQMMMKAGVTDEEFLQQAKRIPALKDALAGNEKLGMDAWQKAKVDKPAQLMALYTDAAFNSTINSETAGQLGKFFGAVKATDPEKYAAALKKGWVPVKNDPSSAGAIFPPDIASKYADMLQKANAVGPRSNNQFLKLYDSVLRLDKTGMTKYLPSHHINNDIGQKFMAFLDGLNNPMWYAKAIKVMARHDGAATGISGDVGRVALKTGSGHVLDPHQIMAQFEGAGLRPSFAGISDLAGEEPKLNNSIAHKVDQWSSAREVHNRLAHFMFALSQEKGSLDEAVQKAAMRVRASHADYADLTPFEKKFMRRVIPFYTWQRKIAPTLIRNAWANPAKVMVYPKAQQAIDQHFGLKPQPGNPFPAESIVPAFLHEGIQASYGKMHGNPVMGAFRTPFDDIVGKELNHPVGNLLDMVTPAIKIPYELMSHKAFGNSNIPTITKNKNAGQYLENQVPLLNTAERITGVDPLRRTPPQPADSGLNLSALINLLTAGGTKEVTPRYQALAAKGK